MVPARSVDASVASFTALYRTWRHLVRQEAFFACGSEADANDVVQVVFLHLWESGSWAEIRHPRAYFKGAARREARRIGTRMEPIPADLEIADPAPGPLRRVIAGQERTLLLDALAALPSPCREVLTLSILRGYSAANVAAECGIVVRTVFRHRDKGKQLLRSWFEARGGAPGWLA